MDHWPDNHCNRKGIIICQTGSRIEILLWLENVYHWYHNRRRDGLTRRFEGLLELSTPLWNTYINVVIGLCVNLFSKNYRDIKLWPWQWWNVTKKDTPIPVWIAVAHGKSKRAKWKKNKIKDTNQDVKCKSEEFEWNEEIFMNCSFIAERWDLWRDSRPQLLQLITVARHFPSHTWPLPSLLCPSLICVGKRTMLFVRYFRSNQFPHFTHHTNFNCHHYSH